MKLTKCGPKDIQSPSLVLMKGGEERVNIYPSLNCILKATHHGPSE